ncbi:MAG: precorrin-6A synthase (deacetylating) [Sphingobium sp.]
MIELSLIGIGTGNPDHLTREAIRAMNRADLILLPRKGEAKSDLIDLRRAICAEVLTGDTRVVEFDMPAREATPPYLDAVRDWHDAIAAIWSARIAEHLPQGGRLALLVWGDPSLYDSTLRIAGRLGAGGMPLHVRVVPGITSMQMLTAAHAIPLNRLAESVLVTTGRLLAERGWPADASSVVAMLDGKCAFRTLPPEGLHIWWGAYLGMAAQTLYSGPLAEAGPRIVEARAALRRDHGWIMDIYLLRRSAPSAWDSA